MVYVQVGDVQNHNAETSGAQANKSQCASLALRKQNATRRKWTNFFKIYGSIKSTLNPQDPVPIVIAIGQERIHSQVLLT